MSRVRFVALLVAGTLALTLPACGGGGQGLRTPSNPVLVDSTSLPPAVSGQVVNYLVELSGGCGGPYVMKLIQGELPPGLHLDDETHSIRGTILADGQYDFTLQIDDTGCNPFSATQASFSWNVGVGQVAVVDVLRDGNPALVPPGGTSFNPDYPALPTTVYNETTSLQFVVAGGFGPYTMKLYDAPGVDDGNLPLGIVIASESPNLVGAPVEVKPGGAPFLLTFELTDSVGSKGYFTVYWKIDTPPIIVASETLADGVCGQQYSDSFAVAEGVPPFNHELVEVAPAAGYTSDVNPNPTNPAADVLYNPDGPPTVNPPAALNKIDAYVYPAPSALGPDYAVTNQGAPPEGLYLIEDTGAITGVPRRRGTFAINYHVTSALVPNSFGQHAWKTFQFTMAQAPSFTQDPSYTIEGAFSPTAPYARISDFEQGQVYNPDGGVPGLQLLASGGVPQDGLSDHPHASQIDADPVVGESAGAYGWSIDWQNPDAGASPIPHVEFLSTGVLRVVSGESDQLATQGYQAFAVSATDAALPTSLAGVSTEVIRTSVGPDTVVITESTTSFTLANSTSATSTGLNDPDLDVKIFLPFTSGAVVRRLDDTKDMVGTGANQLALPSTAGSNKTLKDVLEGIDILRVSINPTGWWNDSFNMNPKGAKGFTHGDANKAYGYRGYNYAYDYHSGSYVSAYGANPSTTAVELPQCTTPGVTEDRDLGVYTSGGQLYAFDSSSYIGVFIVRPESKIYVPIVFDKSSTGYYSFGDNWGYPYSTTPSSTLFKIPQMTVSPDGRFAAMKLSHEQSVPYLYNMESANQSRIVIFTLTGERIAAWGDKTYTIIQTGADGGYYYYSSSGEKLFASSLALTNDHLYYVCGCYGYTFSEYYGWRYEWVYRYDVEGGGLAGSLLASSDPNWTNTYGNPLQLPMQRLYSCSYGYQSGTYGYMYADVTLYSDGYAGHEGSAAPMPFRVNANGDKIAIIAGPTTSLSGDYTVTYARHVWVDDPGGPGLERLSTTARRIPWGASRGTQLTSGPNTSYSYWYGQRSGPATQAEISDDGLKVAVVVERYNGYLSYSANYEFGYAREDVIAYSANGADWSSGATESQVTGTESASTPIFTNNILWSFGGLVFTADGDGLIFWGGASSLGPSVASSSYYYSSHSYAGSLYAWSFSDETVTHLLDYDEGGMSDDQGTVYPTDTSQVSPSFSNGSFSLARNIGTVKPVGGFMSPNRDFYYIVTRGALSSSLQEDTRIVGINVRSLDASQSINGHSDGYAFALGGTNWPLRRSFVPTYGYSSSYMYMMYGIYYRYYGPAGQYGSNTVMTKSGRVFWGSHYQVFGPTPAGTSSYYGGPIESTYHGDDMAFAGQVGYFDSNVGGDPELLTALPETLVSNNYTSTTYRTVKYLEATDDGSSVAFVYAPFSSTYYYYPINCGHEQIGHVYGIQTDPTTGAVLGKTVTADVTGSFGRVSCSITHDTTGTKLFYGFGDASDEKSKHIYASEFTGAGAGTPRQFSFSGDPKRYNVLHAGR